MATTPAPTPTPEAPKRSWLGRRLHSFRFWLLSVLFVILLLVVYHVLSDRVTPLTSTAYAQAYVVQIAPRVEGQVMKVRVKENDEVRQGDVLFEIDPRPFQHRVAQLKAKLARVVQDVAQMESELAALKADDARLDAEMKYADAVYAIDEISHDRGAIADEVYLESLRRKRASYAAKDQSVNLVRKAEQALAARIGNEHALIAETKAELAEAELNLSFTTVVAPSDGLITDLQLRTGSHVKPGEGVLSLIDTRQWFIVADFRESCLENMKPGQYARISFDNYPGRVFEGQVYSIGRGVGQGQGVPSGQLPAVKSSSPWIRLGQRFQVRLVVEDPSVPLRVGMRATVSVYCEREGVMPTITRGVHRFLAWLDYLI